MNTQLSRFQKFRANVLAHKIISTVVGLIVLFTGYRTYQSFTSTSGETRYVVGTVTKGSIVASITGAGQVSTSDQIDLKPKASGDITWVGVKAGDVVHAGQALAQIDSTSAKQSIADAETALAQAKLQSQKDVAQAPIDYQKLQETLSSAKTDLANTYSDSYNTLSTTYLALPSAVTGMQNALYGYDLSSSKSQWNIDALRNAFSSPDAAGVFADVAARDYTIARAKYDASIISYKTLTRYASNSDLESEIKMTIDTSTAVAQALQSELNLFDAIIQDAQTYNRNVSPVVNSLRTSTSNYLATTNNNLSAMLAQQKSLINTKQAIVDDQHSLDIFTINNPTGSTPISLQSSQFSIADQERKLAQMKVNLANYTLTAPFSGTIAVFNLKKFDAVSTGTSAATLITSQKLAEISLNEVDAAKVKIGQKATLTFDAIDGLSIAGDVVEIDTVGTVSQGVVTYMVKVAFGTQDDRVKSGMSVSAAVVTDMKQDILTVPNSAIKGEKGSQYVELFDAPLTGTNAAGSGANAGIPSTVSPRQQGVTAGLSNDTMSEIVSGLTEGQQIVVRSIAPSGTTTQAPSILNAAGVRTQGGGGRSPVGH